MEGGIPSGARGLPRACRVIKSIKSPRFQRLTSLELSNGQISRGLLSRGHLSSKLRATK